MYDSAQTLLIGVDGGGTGCRAAIGTPLNGVLATSKGGPANASSGPELAVENVLLAVASAAKLAGIPANALGRALAHVGLAGVQTPEDSHRIAAQLPYGDVVVSDDRPTSVTGALGGQDGFLLSIGTGTIAAASVDGDFKYVGGWGFHVADQASGAWLGRAALEQVLLCHDKMAAHTDLTRSLFANFDCDPNAVVAFSMSAKPGDYAKFAPEIVKGALSGDPWGRKIMDTGGRHLERCLATLGFKAGDRLCLTGGLGRHYAAFLPAELLTGCIEPSGSALDGAFQMAKSKCRNHAESIG